jgi:putative ABC transport system ATP-binding protein
MRLGRPSRAPRGPAAPRAPRAQPLVARGAVARGAPAERRPNTGAPVRRPPVIQVRDVSKTYRLGEIEVHALHSVSLRIERGDFVAIMGSSGSGKSTLMNILGCLDTPTSGRYLIDGVDVSQMDEDDLADLRNRKIGFVFQSFNLVARTSALVNVELPLAYAGLRGPERRRRAERALRSVGMGNRMDHQPAELSGGQQQRVAIARAIVTNPAMILADEPTGNLDSRSTQELLRIFARLNEDGRTLVLITHEPDVAAQARRVIQLSDGEVVLDRRARAVDDPLPSPHGQPARHDRSDASVAETHR